jgi:hypothetical protein
MGKISRETGEKLKSSGIYFNLPDDKDSAVIRFPFNNLKEMWEETRYAVHVFEDGRKMIDCLRDLEEGGPIEDCPGCAEGYKPSEKHFIPVYNATEDKMQIWTRGATIINQIEAGIWDETDNENVPLVNAEVKITRHGKKKDKDTIYKTKVLKIDDTEIDDLPEIIDVGRALIQLSEDEFDTYLSTGKLPAKDKEDEEEKPKRRLGKKEQEEKSDDVKSTRRNNRRSSGKKTDKF